MTIMKNAYGDPPVTRNDMDFDATEPDNTHLYVPKAAQRLVDRFKNGEDGLTSMQKGGAQLPWVPCQATLNHARVVICQSAALVERQRSWKQLQVMSAAGNECSTTMVEYLKSSAPEVLKELEDAPWTGPDPKTRQVMDAKGKLTPRVR